MTVQFCQGTFVLQREGGLKLINAIIRVFGLTLLVIDVAIWYILKGTFYILSVIPYLVLRATAPMIAKATDYHISKRYSLSDFLSDIDG